MGSKGWHPTKPGFEKAFMTTTIISSEKRRSKSPVHRMVDLSKVKEDLKEEEI